MSISLNNHVTENFFWHLMQFVSYKYLSAVLSADSLVACLKYVVSSRMSTNELIGKIFYLYPNQFNFDEKGANFSCFFFGSQK